MSEPGIIKILKESAESVYKEKGSEFIIKAFPVRNEEEIQGFLKDIKKKYYDASHYCYAFRLKDNIFRYSDAGEPAGTAGIRILNAIDHFEITDILIVVVRYFGGVKLGVGSLGKAYYLSAEQLLKNCSFQEEKPFIKITINADFNFISIVHLTLSNHSAIIENTEYGDKATFECLVPENHLDRFLTELSDSGNGQITVLPPGNKIFHPF
ncbi:MAG TPA: YigZ family protein [Ignavibacteriaceae bacterium]|nr:YigZ family protein [Ignavibacteriaceae bacterium]